MDSPGESPTTFWPPGIHILSSQEHQFLTKIPWADSKQAGTSSQRDGGPYGKTRLFWRAGQPHQHGLWPSPASLLSCLAQLRSHTDTTTFLQALKLPWASPQGAASHRLEASQSKQTEDRKGKRDMESLAWGYTAGQPQSQLLRPAQACCPLDHTISLPAESSIYSLSKQLAHIWLLACCSGGGRQ